MNILVLGSGGRESAMVWKLAQSQRKAGLFVAPGNAGTARWAVNADLDPMNFAQVKEFVIEHAVDMLVVGPEEPLVKGIVDYFQADANFRDLIIVGPCKAGARLEGSKQFAKDFMRRAGIPTAAYRAFGRGEEHLAKDFLRTLRPPYVLKADGLAAGKGVVIASGLAEAEACVEEMLAGQKFGAASEKVVIEEFLCGVELSVFVLTDGTGYRILPEAKDYKKVGEGDTGLNTGGMGAVSPVPFADAVFMKKVEEKIIKPTLGQLKAEHIPYSGFLFIGLMNVAGDPYVIEYNVRMGDPETEAVMPRIESDLVDLFIALHEKRIGSAELKIRPAYAHCLMLTSGGYPQSYIKGLEVKGVEELLPETCVFHAGTCLDKEGRICTDGGRVMALTSLADTLPAAMEKTYAEAEKISFDKMYYRKDIGKDLCR